MTARDVRFADRSDRGKLRLTGPQRAWFLHQILTNEFEAIQPGEAREAALLTVHGRMVGYLEAVATDDALLVHFEPELIPSLPEALRNYVLATRVEIDDITDEMGLVLIVGADWTQVAKSAAPESPVQATTALGTDAGYLWVARDELDAVIMCLQADDVDAVGEDELESIRIANGAGRWGRDFNEKTLPQEARLEDRAIDFDKGCYVGQEAVAKIHFRGKVNRLLRRLEVSGSAPAGGVVTLNGEPVGSVTSSAEGVALAMLKHTVQVGDRLSVDGVAASVVG